MSNKKDKKETKVEFFTDEMHKEIYTFQDTYKNTKGSKPIRQSVNLKSLKR
jgi:hypothetical protein